MPKKKSAKKPVKKLETLYESRRLALIQVMAEKFVTVQALAEKLSPGADAPTTRTMHNKILTLRRATNARKLEKEEATKLAAALGVPLPRLLAGELTATETAAAGGASASMDKSALLKDREELGKDRRTALKSAMGIITAADLHQMLAKAGKKWTRSKVDSYVNGPTFPNKDFLSDAAMMLSVNSGTLIIREHSLENLGRRKSETAASVASAPLVAASPTGGLAVQVTCAQLGIRVDESIAFNGQSKQFLGSVAKVRSDGQRHFLEVSVPIAPEYASVLLGLVLSSD